MQRGDSSLYGRWYHPQIQSSQHCASHRRVWQGLLFSHLSPYLHWRRKRHGCSCRAPSPGQTGFKIYLQDFPNGFIYHASGCQAQFQQLQKSSRLPVKALPCRSPSVRMQHSVFLLCLVLLVQILDCSGSGVSVWQDSFDMCSSSGG